MQRLFPELELQGPGDPLNGGTFYFRKAGQPQFHYMNLSGGEKAAFDLVLDMSLKSAAYDDTVFFIDEPEVHLNSRIQALILEVMIDLAPDSGQLWIATHSIGMMRKAMELAASDPSAVAFLDFEGHDFDEAVRLSTSKPDRQFWSRVLEVALGDVASLVAPEQVVICEGRPPSGLNPARAEFDARCYRAIFADEFPLTDFVSVGSSADVANDRIELGRAIQLLIAGTKVIRVVDRDGRSTQEIADLQSAGTQVLSRRHIESYLLDDEVLTSLCAESGNPGQVAALIQVRDSEIAASIARGNDADDMKSVSGPFSVAAKRLLNLTNAGSTGDAFLAHTLAPLMDPSMAVYSQLKSELFQV